MNVQEGMNAALSVLVSVLIVILLVCLGWYLVWKLFLSRFKLVRELLGIAQSNEHSPVHTLSKDYTTANGNSSSAANITLTTDSKTRIRKVRKD